MKKLTASLEKTKSGAGSGGMEQLRAVATKVNSVMDLIAKWIFRLRKFVLAAPVLYYALKIAAYNMSHLPEQVGLDLQATGEFARTISRELAVIGPFGLTCACLVLMFLSRKALYSWVISIFTLALPLMLLLSNAYPA